METGYQANRRSSGAQCSGNATRVGLPFRSSGARRYVEGRDSINISSLRDEELAKTILLRKYEGVGSLRSFGKMVCLSGSDLRSLCNLWTVLQRTRQEEQISRSGCLT
jgi:hypothetical protein